MMRTPHRGENDPVVGLAKFGLESILLLLERMIFFTEGRRMKKNMWYPHVVCIMPPQEYPIHVGIVQLGGKHDS